MKGLRLGLNLNSGSGVVVDTSPKILAAYGDSIVAQNTGVAARFEAYGYIVAYNILSGQRLIFSHDLNKGSSGQSTSAAVTNMVSSLGSLTCDMITFLCGTNDVGSSVATATIISNLGTVYDYITNTLGKTLIAVCILPRDGMSAAQIQSIKDVNDWIRAQAASNILVVDAYDDFNNGSDAPKTGYTYDGLHPSAIGAFVMGQKMKEVLQPLYGNYSYALSADNIMDNTVMAGPGATSAGSYTGNLATATGTGITGYTYALVGTANAAARTFSFDGNGKQNLDFSFGSALTAAEGFRVSQRIDDTYTANDIAYAEMEVEVKAGASGKWFNLALELRRNNAEACIGYDKKDAGSNIPYDLMAGQRVLIRTPDYVIPASTTRLDARINVESDCSAGAAAGGFIVHNIQLVVRAP